MALDRPSHSLPCERTKALRLGRNDPSIPGTGHDSRCQRMLTVLLEARCKPKQFILRYVWERSDCHQVRFAFRERTRLIDDQDIDLRQRLQCFGIADQHACRRAAPCPDHDRHGCRESQGTGTGNDQHRDGVEQGIGHPRFRAIECPDHEGESSDQDDDRHEIGGNDIGQSLNRSPRALSLTDHTDDLRQQRFSTNSLRAHHKTACPVDGRPHHFLARLLLHRNRLAGDHRFIDSARTFQHHAIDRNLFTRPHT